MNRNTFPPAICYGEILWDILPDGPQPGGAPLNVAYHLNKLGVKGSLASKVGNDSNGKKLESLLDRWGLSKDLLQQDDQYPTSEVLAKMNNGNEVSYEIVFPVAWDFIDDSKLISKQISPSTYFVFGSLASRNKVSKDTLFELLESDVIKVLDINLRPPFIGRELLSDLLKKADIVKFNQAELEMVQTYFRGSYWNEAEQIKFVQDQFNVREVIVTKGEFGASYYKESEAYHAAGREVKVKDTIGSGDAFLAAFIANHYTNEHPGTILRNAIAMGGFVATQKGGCPEYNLSQYTRFRDELFGNYIQ
ncbi:carbohydrate kinase family protein [Mucilaginibacter paludis]|uniref:PfkB domain protein n=1 Tax=Mucilaginibacter paludis DSM 18603 TaxID=714943 RepID=H1YCJ1_9SPHI|nr:carbohydrate kinase [Mucilaginibacter paludis]EHQ30669.1 PfkB domain protein [Mucilaginibacter paludis DSM 18603]